MTSQSCEARRKLYLWRWLICVVLIPLGYAAWQEADFRAALREAKALGWQCKYTDPLETIRKDWTAIFDSGTWDASDREVSDVDTESVKRYRHLMKRIAPRALYIDDRHSSWGERDVSGLKELTTLRTLHLRNCNELRNVDALSGLTELRELRLNGCRSLKNIDGLKGPHGLTELRELNLGGCYWLKNIDGIKGLHGLRILDIEGCASLTNLEAIKGLAGLRKLNLTNCRGLPPNMVAAANAAVPNASASEK